MSGITSAPTQPATAATPITFAVVTSPDRAKVAAFTPHVIQTQALTACAERAVAALSEARIQDAEWMVIPVTETGAATEVCFGTAVGIRFGGPQSTDAIRSAAYALADALVAAGYAARVFAA